MAEPIYATERCGTVAVCDAVVTTDPSRGATVLFATNRSCDEPVTLSTELNGFPPQAIAESWVLTAADPAAANTIDAPDRVAPTPVGKSEVRDGQLHVELPPLSWTMIVLDAR